ncbi:MAG: biopolymer transporter ExbD [Methyloprofundus sp.]|nr:biopolymer transporter ExbD [Methyloprofundus sp.]MDT8425152.1 biopolymer transporter ExbD [Methyloprofundus sp.]
MNFRNKKNNPLEVSLTPMIDVVFLLLIFFMVTTTFSKETSIKIQLPQAEGQEVEQHKQVVLLMIDKSGQFFIDGRALQDKSLATLTKELTTVAANKQVPLIINADANAPVQAAISVLDVAKNIGFKNISFTTQKE